jgi:O-antigen ligase
VQAAIANLPFGSGFGTFVPIYQKFVPRTQLNDRLLNHAHDDWLELWLTGGLPAIALAAAFLAWLAASTLRVWSSGEPGAPVLDLALAQAGSIVIVLLLLHSVVDYPLRMPALSVLFAIACAYLIPRRSDSNVEMSENLDTAERSNSPRDIPML